MALCSQVSEFGLRCRKRCRPQDRTKPIGVRWCHDHAQLPGVVEPPVVANSPNSLPEINVEDPPAVSEGPLPKVRKTNKNGKRLQYIAVMPKASQRTGSRKPWMPHGAWGWMRHNTHCGSASCASAWVVQLATVAFQKVGLLPMTFRLGV